MADVEGYVIAPTAVAVMEHIAGQSSQRHAVGVRGGASQRNWTDIARLGVATRGIRLYSAANAKMGTARCRDRLPAIG